MKKADLDGDGSISTAEFDRALVDAVFDKSDRDRNGSVNYAEWKKIFPDMTEEEYAKHDLGSKGEFTREEAIAHCAEKKTFHKLVGRIDSNGNGIIDPEEAQAFSAELDAADGANEVQKLDSLLR